MNSQRENQLMLARLLDASEDEACERLSRTVLITHGSGYAETFANDLKEVLERTLPVLLANDSGNFDIEVIIGAEPSGRAERKLYVTLNDSETVIAEAAPSVISHCHPLFGAIAVCYAAGMVISKVVDLDKGQGSALHVRFASLGVSPEELNAEITLPDAVLVGAGAVGNGFLRALRHINVVGALIIADPKKVSDGNINRCLYFNESAVRQPKAVQLAKNAQHDFPHLALEARQTDLHTLVSEKGRIRRQFTAMDSRGARCAAQKELPLEVIDASTTGAEEIITHSSRFPSDSACLACIYMHSNEETGRNQDIANGLGVSLEDVAKGFIDAEVAARICAGDADLDPQQITGMAYDSLFKERCAAGLLLLPSGEQILAPFSFVSCLAGALMVIELLRFDSKTQRQSENYFFTSPWRSPYLGARSRRAKNRACEFCSKPDLVDVSNTVWADVLKTND
jgi:hypothetical protein